MSDATAPAAPPDDADIRQRLQQVATTLIGATAAVSALFALLGANSDRVWVILDNSQAKKLLFVTIALAAAAILCGITALAEPDVSGARRWLRIGAVAFVAALGFTVWTAAEGTNQYARPAFSEVSLERDDSGSHLGFVVRVGSLDPSQRIGVRATDVTTNQLIFDGTLLPDESGSAEQKVSVTVLRSTDAVLLEAWHRDRSSSGAPNPTCRDVKVDDGTACVRVSS